MVCPKCGKETQNDARFCNECGTQLSEVQKTVPITRDVPKCTYCGHVGPWIVSPLFRPIDYVCGAIFLIPFVIPGITYLAVIAIIRSNKNNREKICAKCKAKNLFTFIY